MHEKIEHLKDNFEEVRNHKDDKYDLMLKQIDEMQVFNE